MGLSRENDSDAEKLELAWLDGSAGRILDADVIWEVLVMLLPLRF